MGVAQAAVDWALAKAGDASPVLKSRHMSARGVFAVPRREGIRDKPQGALAAWPGCARTSPATWRVEHALNSTEHRRDPGNSGALVGSDIRSRAAELQMSRRGQQLDAVMAIEGQVGGGDSVEQEVVQAGSNLGAVVVWGTVEDKALQWRNPLSPWKEEERGRTLRLALEGVLWEGRLRRMGWAAAVNQLLPCGPDADGMGVWALGP